MYIVIGYHGKGEKKVRRDLEKLWINFSMFAKSRTIQHIYCYQVVDDTKGADALIIVQYKSDVAAKLALPDSDSGLVKQSLRKHHNVNYWFFVRE